MTSAIPAFDPRRDYAASREEYLAVIDRVLSFGRLILGPETDAFEREFAHYVGAASGVGVNSGTDALTLALMALGIEPGDDVLIPALTAPATAAAVRAVGASPRLVDISSDTLTMDPDRARRAVTHATRAMIVVHLHGCPAPMAELAELADKRGLALIEDCAQAHGTHYRGRHVGTLGAVGCFSFYPTKNLGALGDAGMCVTRVAMLESRLRRLRSYGLDANGVAQMDGRNSRLDELQAALLRVKLRRLDEALERRREIAAIYRRELADADLELPPETEGHSYHQFVVRTPQRPKLMEDLSRRGISFGLHYGTPLHAMPPYRWFGYQDGDLPAAEAAAASVLSLPIFPELEDDEIQRVCSAVAESAGHPARS